MSLVVRIPRAHATVPDGPSPRKQRAVVRRARPSVTEELWFRTALIARLSPPADRPQLPTTTRQDVQEIQGQARGGDEAVTREAAGERATIRAGRSLLSSTRVPTQFCESDHLPSFVVVSCRRWCRRPCPTAPFRKSRHRMTISVWQRMETVSTSDRPGEFRHRVSRIWRYGIYRVWVVRKRILMTLWLWRHKGSRRDVYILYIYMSVLF